MSMMTKNPTIYDIHCIFNIIYRLYKTPDFIFHVESGEIYKVEHK